MVSSTMYLETDSLWFSNNIIRNPQVIITWGFEISKTGNGLWKKLSHFFELLTGGLRMRHCLANTLLGFESKKNTMCAFFMYL